MRILVFHLHDRNFEMGGADRGVLDLSAALRAAGEEVRIMTNAGPFARAAAEKNIPVVEIPSSKLALFKTLGLIQKETLEFKPQIYHSHHRYTTFLLDLFFKGKGVPILHTQRIQTWSRRFLFRSGDFIAAVSESLRKHMVDYFHVPENRTRAVVNAVSLKLPAPETLRVLREKFPRQPGQLFALCSGRFHEQKGHVYLIEAVDQLAPEFRKKIKIFLAGDGPLEDELKRKIREKNLEANFVFCGYITEMSAYLEFCDFVVLPSLWEGLPRVILEGFFMGKPAIATDIPGTADVLEHETNGLLVEAKNPRDLRDALYVLLQHPERLVKMREAAKQSSSNYSFETMVHNYQRLYRELAAEVKLS